MSWAVIEQRRIRIGLLSALILLSGAAVAAPIDQGEILVIEGDLIRIHRQRPDVRLLGFNAPEVLRAHCRTERAIGEKSAQRLRAIVRAGNLAFESMACPCPPRTEGTKACNNGRRCGRLTANGRDVGSILMEEKLAVPFACSETGCPVPPRPWCRAVGLR
jgi:endonuclease YncB( thermonuclease family)